MSFFSKVWDTIVDVAKSPATGVLLNAVPGVGTSTAIARAIWLSPESDPQRAYMWEIAIRDPNGKNDDSLKFFAKQTAFPPSMAENVKQRYQGVEYSYPGRDTSPRIFRVTFWDSDALLVYKFFMTWYELMNTPVENYKISPSGYNGNATITLFRRDGEKTAGSINLTEIYPIEISEVALGYTDSSEITFDVMFSYRVKEVNI